MKIESPIIACYNPDDHEFRGFLGEQLYRFLEDNATWQNPDDPGCIVDVEWAKEAVKKYPQTNPSVLTTKRYIVAFLAELPKGATQIQYTI